MKKKKTGWTAPQKQPRMEDGLECYSVAKMPRNVKERSQGRVKCENDIVVAVKTVMEGETTGKPWWCKNRCDSLSGVAMVVESKMFLSKDEIEMMEKRLGGDVSVRAIGDDFWLVTVFWLE